jgi:hypothetical protein
MKDVQGCIQATKANANCGFHGDGDVECDLLVCEAMVTNVSEELIASVFRIEMVPPARLHGVLYITQKHTVPKPFIFTMLI